MNKELLNVFFGCSPHMQRLATQILTSWNTHNTHTSVSRNPVALPFIYHLDLSFRQRLEMLKNISSMTLIMNYKAIKWNVYPCNITKKAKNTVEHCR